MRTKTITNALLATLFAPFVVIGAEQPKGKLQKQPLDIRSLETLVLNATHPFQSESYTVERDNTEIDMTFTVKNTFDPDAPKEGFTIHDSVKGYFTDPRIVQLLLVTSYRDFSEKIPDVNCGVVLSERILIGQEEPFARIVVNSLAERISYPEVCGAIEDLNTDDHIHDPGIGYYAMRVRRFVHVVENNKYQEELIEVAFKDNKPYIARTISVKEIDKIPENVVLYVERKEDVDTPVVKYKSKTEKEKSKRKKQEMFEI